MADFVTANNKFFCSHFKELDEYLKEKDLSPQPLNQDQKEDMVGTIEYWNDAGASAGGFECFKKVGKYVFKCSSLNYRGQAEVLVFKKSGKGFKFINYISGIKTLKSALIITTY